MRFRMSCKSSISHDFLHVRHHNHYLEQKCFLALRRRNHTSSHEGSRKSQGKFFLVPGATAATLIMLGALHSRRMYNDKKYAEARERGQELEFNPDFKATFMRMLPLRSISRGWGALTSIELPLWLRPYVYKAWARAFHSDLEEAALPLENYASLRDFFVRNLKEGCRPIDPDPRCLVSPVDGIVLRFGEIKESGAMIEQVKGFCYSVSSLLGSKSLFPMISEDHPKESKEQEKDVVDKGSKPWWRLSLASPEIRCAVPSSAVSGLYYCVIYLRPGDYHHIHSPTDWNVLNRRHFSGNLFPMNERSTRTIRNLYVENERVVLEGSWREGFMAITAIGATNIGSIELYIEPELKTNKPVKDLLIGEPPEERLYEPEGVGISLRKGDEIGAFNMGSTVVLIFQASEFEFNVKRVERVRVGQALGTLSITSPSP